jgi:hypothetical protein
MGKFSATAGVRQQHRDIAAEETAADQRVDATLCGIARLVNSEYGYVFSGHDRSPL